MSSLTRETIDKYKADRTWNVLYVAFQDTSECSH